ncbi:MAG: alpha/beta hydrolase [Hyphomonas sp.]
MSVRMIFVSGGVLLVAAAVLVVLIAAWLQSKALVSPPGYYQAEPEGFAFTDTPQSVEGLDYEDVSFTVPSGETLRGWLVPAAAPSDIAVVTLHGRGSDRRGFLSHLGMLHSLGANVLLFDFRENGLSDGKGRGTGLAVREAEDAVAAAAEMRRLGYGRVVVYGCSLGGSAAIIAAANDADINGVIAEGSIATFEKFVADGIDQRLKGRGLNASWVADLWGNTVIGLTRWRIGLKSYVSAEDAMARIAPRPVLIMHGQNDNVVLDSHARLLVARGETNLDYWPIEGAGHCDGYQVAGDAYRERVAQFLAALPTAD